MQTINITINNKMGLHARPSAKIAETAGRFNSNILITNNNKSINAKSIMHVMMLAASQGTQMTISAEGNDEKAAIAELEALFKSNFGESE